MARNLSPSLERSLSISCVVLFVFALTTAQAQITNVTNDTAMPMEGGGHDYIHLLSETVNPANGSVSLNISLPTPKGRGLSVPFSIQYDSDTQYHLVPIATPGSAFSWVGNSDYFAQSGWKYSLPTMVRTNWSEPQMYPPVTTNLQNPPCAYTSQYILQDLSGVTHALGIGTSESVPNLNCLYGQVASTNIGEFTVNLAPCAGICSDSLFYPVTATDRDGTVYYFDGSWVRTHGDTTSIPTYVKDRNGNTLNFTGTSTSISITDTVGRTVVSTSGFGTSGATNTVTVGANNYQVSWKAVTGSSVAIPSQPVYPPALSGCQAPPPLVGGGTVISTITLPNGGQYKFYYSDNPDPTFRNPYGLLSEIDYPSGAWVKYTYKLSDTMSEVADSAAEAYDVNGYIYTLPDYCEYLYKRPVVASRQVGFGGSSTPNLTQTFTYSATWSNDAWTSKSTTLFTTDPIFGTAKTVYSYLAATVPAPPFVAYSRVRPQIPVERSVQYYNWDGSLKRTVTKAWASLDPPRLACQAETNDGVQIGGVYNQYDIHINLVDTKEYDFTKQGVADCSTPSISPVRDTQITQTAFTNVVGQVFERPSAVVVYSNASPVSETDYAYDQTAVSSVTAVQHDDTNFGTSYNVRGNATTKTVKCLGATGCPGNSITTYAYDITGQVLTVKDPCGNGTCADMTGSSHTTTLSYADHYTVLSGGQNVSYTPTGNTNAYLTQVTNPLGQISKLTYDFNNGQLTASQDQNDINANRPGTTYVYNDPFARPTQANSPDGGQVTYSYNDSSYNSTNNTPSVAVTKKVNSTLNVVTTTATDGVGHVVRTLLTSDPDGTDITDTTYTGMEWVRTQSNPHRTAFASTDGTTTYSYDALGRTASVTKQDGSIVNSSDAGNCTTVIDEAGKIRKSCSDGLGRLIEVDEPGGANLPGTAGTGTVTVTGGPDQSGTFNTCPGNPNGSCWTTIPDGGSVNVTANGFTSSGSYGPGYTTQGIASSIAAGFNVSSSPVTAVASGTVITITARATGVASNYPLSTSVNWNSQYFSSPSFSASASGLAGGTDASLGSNPLVTLYTYDVLNNLTCAVQKGTDTTGFTTCAAASSTWRPRSFGYDPLSRLTSATNPESGTISYTYDLNGNVSTKVAPSPNKIPADTSSPQIVTTTFTCDALNRLTKKTYSDGTTPTVQFGYDGLALSGCTYTPPTLSDTNPKGRRTSMCDGSGATTWALDITSGIGWKSTEARTINGTTNVTKNTISQNNLGGVLSQLTYPTGRIVNYTSGGAARFLQAQDSDGTNYAANATYAPFGGLLTAANGAAPINVSNAYDKRSQPATLSASTAANTLFSKSYDFHLANGDNGNVFQIVNNLDNTRSQSLTYDALNRIATAQSQATSGTKCWGDSFTIDNWGNLTNKTVTKCTAETLSAPATTNNQISGYCYSKAGNLLGTSACPSLPYTPAYTYDAENRLKTAGGVTYTYDGDGNRVKKSNGTLYWGIGALAESDLSASATSWKEYIFFGGRRIARRDASNSSVHYFYSDHLGSSSVIVNGSTSAVEEDLDYFPYGGIAYGNTADHYLFTGKERDIESGLDDFGARYDSSTLGRFISVDPAYRSEILELPQTWNRYSYVYNRPTFATDPDGRCPPCIGALVGGVVQGSWNLGTQLYRNGGHLSQVSGRELVANIAGGAVSGAIAGATGGASLLVTATVSSVGDVAGGIVTRTIEGQDTTADDIEEDAVSGFVGGAAGHLAADFIHPPEEPVLPGKRRHAVGRRKLAKYDAAVKNRNNMEMWHAGVDIGAATNAANGSRLGFWSFLDWLSQPPPPPTPPGPPLNPHSTSRIIDCHDMQGMPCQ